jgi:hypothetical protein
VWAPNRRDPGPKRALAACWQSTRFLESHYFAFLPRRNATYVPPRALYAPDNSDIPPRSPPLILPVTFERVPDVQEDVLQIGNRPSHGNLSDERSLDAR